MPWERGLEETRRRGTRPEGEAIQREYPCRGHGFPDVRGWRWRSTQGGMDVPDAELSKALQETGFPCWVGAQALAEGGCIARRSAASRSRIADWAMAVWVASSKPCTAPGYTCSSVGTPACSSRVA